MLYHTEKLKHAVFWPANSIHFRSVTKKHLPFSIGYVCVFIWLYAFFLPMGGFKFESELYNRNTGNADKYYCVWLFVSCLLPLLLNGKKFVPKTIYSVAAALFCFGALRFTGPGIVSQVLMLAASVCIGHIFASNVYGFFMVLNNSEKFYTMTAAVLLPRVLIQAKPTLSASRLALDIPSIIILVIMLLLAVCSFFYRNVTDEMPASAGISPPRKAYSLLPLLFVVLAINDVIAPTILRRTENLQSGSIEQLFFWGIVAGIALVLLLQNRFAVNLCNMLNISFALLAVGFVVDIISCQSSEFGPAAAVLFGASYAIGFVNIYYLAGLMTKKFQSVPFYRVLVVMATLYYFMAFFAMTLFQKIGMVPPTVVALACVCLVLVFFILAPYFRKMLYDGEWIEDSYRQDVTNCSRLEAKLKDYRLAPAEIAVCRLLLEGYTLRQIAGIQSRAYATINTYCTSIYRKMNINSRVELVILLKDYTEK